MAYLFSDQPCVILEIPLDTSPLCPLITITTWEDEVAGASSNITIIKSAHESKIEGEEVSLRRCKKAASEFAKGRWMGFAVDNSGYEDQMAILRLFTSRI